MEKQDRTTAQGDLDSHGFPGDVVGQLGDDKINVPSSSIELVRGGPINPRQVRVCLLLLLSASIQNQLHLLVRLRRGERNRGPQGNNCLSRSRQENTGD